MRNWLLFPLILFGLPGLAQIQFSSLEEVLGFADQNAIALQQARIGEQISLTGKREAKAGLYPNFNTQLGYNDNITLQPTLVPAQMFNPAAAEDTYEEFTFGTKYQYSAGIQVQWDILNFQKLFAVRTADKEILKSRANIEVHRFNTYNSIASTYYSILLTQESIRIYEENLEVSTSILDVAKEKYEKGIISEAELNQAAIKQIQNKRNLDAAKNNLQQFHLQLQSQLNTKQSIEILDEPANFALEDMMIQSRHPEVLLQEMEVQKHESLLKQKKSMLYPSISLVYQNNRTWATNDFMDFSTANALPQQYFGVQINLLGSNRFTTKQKIKQSEWELQMQRMQLENTKLVKQKEDELLQLELQKASQQLTDNQYILRLQEKNDQHAENKYQGGIIGLDERLNKYDDLLATQDMYLQSLASFSIAQYKTYIRQINFQTK
ncbi:MAG: TolC family protein [Saprospiraceae bacterium]|nr:TolC family protein [Saprospiraceae bacterium]